jgi:capsular exopolysaccharide synthesis family protein
MSPMVSDSALASAGSDSAGLKRYYLVLLERLPLVIACIVLTAAAAALYVRTAPKKYSAEAQLLVSPVPSDNPTLFTLPVLHSTSDPTQDVLTAASLMTTPEVAAATARALDLKASSRTVLADVQATPIGQSNLVAIQASGRSAASARALANTFAQQVIATRTAALHAAIAAILPGLKSQVAALPPSQRNGAGTLGDQLSQLEQLQAGKDPTITVASLADLPAGPYSPKTSLSIAAGVFGGLIIGIGAAFAFNALDPRLRREEQIGEVLDLPVLARIPRQRSRKHDLPMLPDELSFSAHEGYRTLRTMLTSRAAGQPRAYLVTGSSPAEGKTTTAISLAVSLAQGGARAILIEADLRRPTIGTTLRLRPEYGTEHVLSGEVELADALTEANFDGVPLRVLAVHRAGLQLVDLLSFGVAQRLIKDAMALADFVVIDAPPLTTVIDALPLAQLADEVVVVARLGVSKLKNLGELHNMVISQGSHASGIVLIGQSPMRRVPYYYRQPDQADQRNRVYRPEGEPARTLSD